VKSVNNFTHIFGFSPKVKVMDLFLSESDAGFTKSAIARLTDISRTTLIDVCDELVKIKFLYLQGQKYYLNKCDRNISVIYGFYIQLNNIVYTPWEVSVDE